MNTDPSNTVNESIPPERLALIAFDAAIDEATFCYRRRRAEAEARVALKYEVLVQLGVAPSRDEFPKLSDRAVLRRGELLYGPAVAAQFVPRLVSRGGGDRRQKRSVERHGPGPLAQGYYETAMCFTGHPTSGAVNLTEYPRVSGPDEGAVLGIDVGFSLNRATTCFCLLEWTESTVRLSFEPCKTAKEDRIRAFDKLVSKNVTISCVAIDGPLTRSLRRVPHYRSAEALLSRGVFQKRGKPGQTSAPTGQQLHDQATGIAEMILQRVDSGQMSLAMSSHVEAIHGVAITEAFPNIFLGVMLDEHVIPKLNRDASDRYWELLVGGGGLTGLVAYLLPGRELKADLSEIRDHEQRAAAVCALTALAVARKDGVGVGDPEDGDIWLPPVPLWGRSSSPSDVPWAAKALRQNVSSVRRRPSHPNHTSARVRLHDACWTH